MAKPINREPCEIHEQVLFFILRISWLRLKIVETKPANFANKDEACVCCGSFETMEIGGQVLCVDCITLVGCGCAGSGSGAVE